MNEGLGLWLRRTREARELTLEDAVQSLRIKRRYLQALEVGDYAALPGEIQTRGFLRNYARFLGLSSEDVVARYEAEVEGRPFQPRSSPKQEESLARFNERPTIFPAPPSEQEESRPTRGVPRGVIQLMIVAFLIFFAIFIFGLLFLRFGVNLSLPTDVRPTDAPVLPATPVEASVTVESTVSAAPAPTFNPAPNDEVLIRLEPQEHAWISVSADADIVFQGVATPGQPIQATASETLIAATGNGGAFKLYVNGDDWGLLGEQGEVVRRAWSPDGELRLDEQQ
jgi:cytoskeletal protein RodZ